ncbi:hypothetical protein N658DRAFT_562405 [Parathielavia hyrcaniae]|uniref:Uncharacterized protein n=1 Tax=Parathielavia hyrcaniae TaxID=113614 RepID=A0AAN6SXI7_9PEZI|nr:hypothetical protein N658DRAFT_562405 [Parathielavia hyrcaniae]
MRAPAAAWTRTPPAAWTRTTVPAWVRTRLLRRRGQSNVWSTMLAYNQEGPRPGEPQVESDWSCGLVCVGGQESEYACRSCPCLLLPAGFAHELSRTPRISVIRGPRQFCYSSRKEAIVCLFYLLLLSILAYLPIISALSLRFCSLALFVFNRCSR